jgi:hypothetical protein
MHTIATNETEIYPSCMVLLFVFDIIASFRVLFVLPGNNCKVVNTKPEKDNENTSNREEIKGKVVPVLN